MRSALGIDGGSSSLRAVATGAGQPRRFEAEGGTNLHEDDEDVVVARLGAVWAALGPAASVCVGTAGIDAPGDRERFARVFAAAFPGARLEVCSDVEIIAACGSAATRVCVISGTGSNVYGVGPRGEAWAGGLDLPLTDWGSAAWIGEAALRRALREAAGMDPAAVGPALFSMLGLAWPGDWRALKTVRAEMHKAELAALARPVAELAEGGVAAAREILEAAGDELADAIGAVLQRVEDPRATAELLTVGSVVNRNPIVRGRVVSRWALLRPGAPIHEADAATGAARRAASAAP